MVGHLRNSLREIEPDLPVLLEKVLYSGTHCGDELSLEDIERALAEIRLIQTKPIADGDVQNFLNLFGELLQTARSHGLPIVF